MPDEAYRMDIGQYKCTVFNDGWLTGEGETFGLNCLLIESGREKILVDTGGGSIGFQAETTGRLKANLAAAGIKGVEINKIIFTHGHGDHVGGAYDARGQSVFPNARYITSVQEWDGWLEMKKNDPQNWLFESLFKRILPARDRFDLFDAAAEILTGIKLQITAGHTPGNLTVDISSGGKRLFCIGDVIHSLTELTKPDLCAAFDTMPEQAMTARMQVLARLANSGVLVFACHFEFPGMGYIRQAKGVFSWESLRAA